jgi:hypothetical protein
LIQQATAGPTANLPDKAESSMFSARLQLLSWLDDGTPVRRFFACTDKAMWAVLEAGVTTDGLSCTLIVKVKTPASRADE